LPSSFAVAADRFGESPEQNELDEVVSDDEDCPIAMKCTPNYVK
jgi:hypothetical protein